MQLRSRRRVTAAAGFALLALLAELTGRELTNRLDGALNVAPFATPTTRYYPFLLAGVRAIAALVVAAAVWRVCRAHASAAAGERLLGIAGPPPASARAPLAAPLACLVLSRPRSGTSSRPTPPASPRAAGRCSRRGCTPTRCRSSPSARSCSRSAGARSATGSPTSRTTRPRPSPAPRRMLRAAALPPRRAPRR